MLILKGERSKKSQFFGENFQKKALKAVFGLFFFQNFACRAQNWPKQGFLSALGELRKSICST